MFNIDICYNMPLIAKYENWEFGDKLWQNWYDVFYSLTVPLNNRHDKESLLLQVENTNLGYDSSRPTSLDEALKAAVHELVNFGQDGNAKGILIFLATIKKKLAT